MSQISPMQKRIIAASIFIIIILSLVGNSVYQTYFANPVKSMGYKGDASQFTLPSTENTNYTWVPSDQKVTILTFFYTKCPGDTGCVLLTVNMGNLADRITNKGMTDVTLVSVDFDYINDTMSDLQLYASQYSKGENFWKFLLGNKNQTDSLAAEFGFFFQPSTPVNSTITLSHGGEDHTDPYVHAMNTYILDRAGNIRSIIPGTDWDFPQIMNSIRFLQSSDWQTGLPSGTT